jgi:hypothetical protein
VGPVTAIRPAADSGVRQRPAGAPSQAQAERGASGRALVPLPLARPTVPRQDALQRPSAAFLAQLIAAQQKLPQARERRRAEPHEAIAAYMAAARAA